MPPRSHTSSLFFKGQSPGFRAFKPILAFLCARDCACPWVLAFLPFRPEEGGFKASTGGEDSSRTMWSLEAVIMEFVGMEMGIVFPVSPTEAVPELQLDCSKCVILNQQSQQVRIWSGLYEWCVCVPPGASRVLLCGLCTAGN